MNISFNQLSGLLFCVLFIVSCGGNQSTEPVEQNPAPVITVLPVVEQVTPSSAIIVWTTDLVSNSTVKYDTVSASFAQSQTDPAKVTEHRLTLVGLQSSTTYYFRVESENIGGFAYSPEGQFTTLRTASELNSLGWAAYESGQIETAINWFRSALSERDADLDALTGLGWCYSSVQMNHLDSSLVYFDEVIRYRDDYTEALAGRGFIRLAFQQYSGAVRDFEKIVTDSPDFIFQHNSDIDIQDVRLGLAEIYFLRDQYIKVQDQMNILAPDNGLDSEESNTWIVDQIQYDQYPEALLAWLEKLRPII